jgi:O-antigen/teichoic acid export membrane protein
MVAGRVAPAGPQQVRRSCRVQLGWSVMSNHNVFITLDREPRVDTGKLRENKERRVVFSVLLLYTVFGTKALTNILALSITERTLSETMFGLWVLLQSIGSYLFIFDSGLSQIVMNLTGAAYSKKNYEQISSIITSALAIFISFAICVSALALCAIAWLGLDRLLVKDYKSVSDVLPACLAVFIPLTMFRFAFRVFSGALNGLRHMHTRLLIDLLHPLIFVCVVAVTLLVTDSLLILVVTSTASVLFVFSLFLPVTMVKFPFLRLGWAHFRYTLCKNLLRKMLQYAPLPACLLGQRLIPVFLLSSLDGLGFLPALYLVIMVYRVLIFFVSDSISKAFQPYVIYFHAVGNISRISFLWKLSTKVTTLVSILLLTFSLWWYGIFAKLILGGDVAIIPGLAAIYAFLCLLDSMLSTGVNNLIAMNKYGKLSALWLSEAAVAIGLGVLGGLQSFVPPIVGISLGFLIAKLLISLPGHLWLFSKFMNTSLSTLVWQMAARRMLVAVGAVCASLSLVHYGGPRFSIANNIIYSFGTCAVLSILFWRYDFSRDERNWITERVVQFLGADEKQEAFE